MVQLMPLYPKTSQSHLNPLDLPFWYRLTQTVLEKRPLNGVVVVAAAAAARICYTVINLVSGLV